MKRDKSIDLIKGFGIFCMVAGHCGAPFEKFIYLFHMAVFFIASGYCYKKSNSDKFGSVFKYIVNKLKSLWLVYVLWNTLFSLLHNFFIKINVYTDNPLIYEYVSGERIALTEYWSFKDVLVNIIKTLFMQGGTQLGGAFWFFQALLGISVGYCLVDFLIKKLFSEKLNMLIQAIVAVVFLVLGYVCSLKGITAYGVARILSCYSLFFVGHLIRNMGIYDKARSVVSHIITLAVCFGILVLLNSIGRISLGNNTYVNPIFMLVASLMGWQMLHELAFFIRKVKIFENIVACMGQNTLAIVLLHFLCFKAVSYIGVACKGMPLCTVAAFPFLFEGPLWCIAYLLVGLIIPICLSILWKNIKHRIKKQKPVTQS